MVVKVIPNAGRNQVVGWENGVLKVRIVAIPEKGKANRELINYLAEVLNISKAQIELVSGETKRIKRFVISGVSEIPH